MRWDEVLGQLRKKNMKRMKPHGESRYRILSGMLSAANTRNNTAILT